MALTATAQSAFREPAWDEVIVPTLRKRLKDESNVLARRISAISMGSDDGAPDLDLYQSATFLSRQEPANPTTHYTINQKPSAIPRPSLQQSRTAGDSPNGSGRPFHPARSRTLSQPYALDSPTLFDTAAFPSGPSRSTSPMMNGKTTRIPVSRGRAGSTSSYGQGSVSTTGRAEQELWPVDEGQPSYSTRSTVRLPRTKGSELFKEAAPFGTDSRMSSQHEFDHDFADAHRFSTESEERPFEHWYRGDVSRNGGVGELRVGKREEMLDIANYGHTFNKGSFRPAHSNFSRSRSTSRGRDLSGSRYGSRQRAESINGAVRQSIYLDEDEHVKAGGMVLDEQPPTEFEAESDDYEEQDEVYEHNIVSHPNATASSPSLALNTSQLGHTDASRHKTTQSNMSRIPTPTSLRQLSAPPRTPTPTKPVRGASEPKTSASTPSTPTSQRLPRSQSQPQTTTKRASLAKRKAKSPATTASVSTAKKAKTKPPSSMRRTVPQNSENRRSIGQYPAPDGDDVVDAIPSWTQPVPPSGNWDDVVLPVVARKKGLENHYSTADGSPRQKKTGSEIYEPAPGTFGYDYSKYRRQPPVNGGEQIPMDEFGHKTDAHEEIKYVDEQPAPQPPATLRSSESDHDRIHPRISPPPSPPPFAHYAAAQAALRNGGPQVTQPAPEIQKLEHDAGVDDDGGAGCCKCVIM